MIYKYGDFSNNQISETKKLMRKKIFYLLLCVDPKTCNEHKDTDIIKAFDSTLREFGGLNDILFHPTPLVRIISLLEAALVEVSNPDFTTNDFEHCAYRKLVLDAGAEVMNIKEV